MTPPSLPEIYRALSDRPTVEALAREATEHGDADTAEVLRRMLDDNPAAVHETGDEPIPFLLTSQGYGATRPDIAPPDERGLTGGEGGHLTGGPTLSAEGAARALTEDGRSLDDARLAVRAYQDAATATLGTPVHAWGLDRADLDEIRAGTTGVAPVIPLPRPSTAAEDTRRAELADWHAADTATGHDTAVDASTCIERTERP